MEIKEKKVGIGDYKIATPPDRLITIGLGSCVGIAIYDEKNRIAGLSHIMLPLFRDFKRDDNPMKFADTAIPMMVDEMVKNGADVKKMVAKIAGGAKMFAFANSSDIMDIGKRNVEAVIDTLNKLNIPILASDTGGNSGRTMLVEAATGTVFIRVVGKTLEELTNKAK